MLQEPRILNDLLLPLFLNPFDTILLNTKENQEPGTRYSYPEDQTLSNQDPLSQKNSFQDLLGIQTCQKTLLPTRCPLHLILAGYKSKNPFLDPMNTSKDCIRTKEHFYGTKQDLHSQNQDREPRNSSLDETKSQTKAKVAA